MAKDGVSRLLVTANPGEATILSVITGARANWIESRPCGDRVTCLVTVFAEDESDFLRMTSQQDGVTVQRVIGDGDDETYELLTGALDGGWKTDGGDRDRSGG